MEKEISKEEALKLLDTVIVSCEEGQDGSWDTTTDEGKEGFGDMIALLEKVKEFIED